MSGLSIRITDETGSRSQPNEEVSVTMPADDWFCSEFKQMNLHLIQGHISRAEDRIGYKKLVH